MKYLIITVMALMLVGCAKPKDGAVGAPGQSITGPKGDVGGQGTPGVNGSNGSDGEDGTQITVVQFCQSCHTHYPDTYAEVGFCIDGSLYATYSANGGFSVPIPAGTYSSNGINCSCTFTVSAGCQVN